MTVVMNTIFPQINYILLLRELKNALSARGYMLTAAVHCGKKTIDNGYDIGAMVE
jgi:hypothetical protein